MISNNCRKNKAQWDEYYGWLPCKPCTDRQSKLSKPHKQIEFTTASIKLQRKAHWQDIHGHHRKGELSKEYVDKWGKKKVKQLGYSDQEIKKAKKVWGDDLYYG